MIILTHIGKVIPNYISIFLEQLRKINPNHEIVFLVNRVNLENDIFIKNDIKTYPIEDLNNSLVNSFISKFGYGDHSSYDKEVIYASSDYWCVTATRLFYLYEYANKFNIKEYFHFENDIMIYEDISKIFNTIKSNNLFENKILITRGTNNKIMTGFMYVDDNNLLFDLLLEIDSYLLNKGDLFNYGIDMINEMSLLHVYQIKNDNKVVSLPILPNGLMSNGFDCFNSVFDPATYGQYLDGAPGNPGLSITTDSYIGDDIKRGLIKIVFENIDGFKIPFLIDNENKIKINNLHIHSKRLELFLS